MVGALPAKPWPQTLEAIEALLFKRQMRSELIEPQAGDEDNYNGDSQVAAANATTTITWTLKKDYIYYFKKLYVDAAANITSTWKVTKVIGFYEGEKSMDGNEHEFDLPLRVQGGATVVLTITNTGAVNTLDIVIRSWARRVIT